MAICRQKPTCRVVLDTLANTAFSQVTSMTGDKSPDVTDTAQPAGVWTKKMTHRNTTYRAKPRTLSIDSTSTRATRSFDAYAKNQGPATTTARVTPSEWTRLLDDNLLRSCKHNKEQGISKTSRGVKNLKNLLPVSRIVLLSPKLRNYLPFQKIARNIRSFLRKSETFFNIMKVFSFFRIE